MADISLSAIISNINVGWHNHYHASFTPRAGQIETRDKDGNLKFSPWVVPDGFLTLQYINPRNVNKPQRIIISCGEYPEFEADHLDVSFMMDFGEVSSNTEIIRGRLDKYILERMEWLREHKCHLDSHDKRFPITWTPLVFGTDNGMLAEYTIYGTAKIPLITIGENESPIDYISRLLIGGFNSREHPNDYDDYLYLNERGYIDDCWTN